MYASLLTRLSLLRRLVGCLCLLLVGAAPAAAQVVPPSQGSSVSAVWCTTTTMELQFGYYGNGHGRVVAMALVGNRPGQTPLNCEDDQFYTASTVFGQGSPLRAGYVVYNGTGKSAQVTGLTPGKYYYITSAEYNTDGVAIRYNGSGTSISIATLGMPLPVTLTAFTGSVTGGHTATLQWATASESNSDYYALESSFDGSTFREAGRVAAAGTSTGTLKYQWVDPQALSQATYYRLRQVDIGGVVHYGPVLLLAPAGGKAHLSVYPNPSTGGGVQLALQGYAGQAFEARLFNAVGQQVVTCPVNAVSDNHRVLLALPEHLPAGNYVLLLTNGATALRKRLTITE